ncbi:DUF3079 domain-containing protein [Roseateles flavus]|uniref:DUF3079 domain-containing protein n=1 Tax=Roseateles flavus TaxID=3149041 RepID=A0ABV0G9Q8_9BURK
MAKKFPLLPAQPQRVCWGCDLYCPSESMRCGNGSVRTPHPSELFGEDWALGLRPETTASEPPVPTPAPAPVD